MDNKKFSQHRGPISLAMIAEGMNIARANAKRLFEDASALYEAGRTHSAVALAILSIEESGKISILRQMALCESEAEWRQAWKDYRSHIRKNVAWILGELAAKGARTIDELRPIVNSDSDHPNVLDNLKQLCLYTDCVNNSKWTSPEALEIKDLASYLLLMAKAFVKGSDVTEKELQLWRLHLLPAKRGSFEENKRAVANWWADMGANGLSSATEEEIEAFLRPVNVH
ncbi:MAG TPA: AbiV family abortive infection protein [Syntrophus sp. (in: bacteria)]|jgi:AbiV family abortive infection protein|nr:AbiV family abortive infection protein [Syntrophus sp. (in: bacteria)]